MPEPGQEETVRVVAMDKSFHVQCYRCEVSLAYLYKHVEAAEDYVHVFAMQMLALPKQSKMILK